MLRYFLFSSLVLSVLFLASCDEEVEGPTGAISLSVNGEAVDGNTYMAAPGASLEITATIGTSTTDQISVVTNGPAVNVPSSNTFTSGGDITVTVPATASLDDEATLTFSSGGVNRQLTIEVGYQTVVDAVMADGNLSILEEAVVTAGLVDALSDEDSTYTVFAPTNQAFANLLTALGATEAQLLARDDLDDILLYHVVGETAASGDLTNGQILETLHPEKYTVIVTIDGNTVKINNATVVTRDIETGNGVVHIIDQVLLPQTVAEYEPVLLAAPTADRNSDTFFSADNGNTYTVNEVIAGTGGVTSADIDFGYYYGSGSLQNLATLAAPSAYPKSVQDLTSTGANWSALNATSFRPTNLTLEAFNAITAADAARLVQEYEVTGGTPVNQVVKLIAGNMLTFKTVDNRYGLIFVEEVVGTDGANGRIELKVKVTQ